MYKPPTYPAELIEVGREVPSLFRSLPHDETLTEGVIKAGFTHCFGVPYNAPPDRNTVAKMEGQAMDHISVCPECQQVVYFKSEYAETTTCGLHARAAGLYAANEEAQMQRVRESHANTDLARANREMRALITRLANHRTELHDSTTGHCSDACLVCNARSLLTKHGGLAQ